MGFNDKKEIEPKDFNRDDADSSDYGRFAKERRPRMTTSQRVERERKPRTEEPDFNSRDYQDRQARSAAGNRPERDFNRSDDGPRENAQRRSFNPNFDRDNRPVGGHGEREWKPRRTEEGDRPYQKPQGNREDRPYNKERQPRPAGEGRPAGKWSPREDKPYEKPSGPWKPREEGGGSYGKPAGKWSPREDKPYEKPSGPWKPREEGGGSYGKPAGKWSPRGEGKSYEKPAGPRRPNDSRDYGDERRSSGQKPYADRKPSAGGKRPAAPKYDKDNYPRFSAPKQNEPMRLNRYISISGVCSRREADDYISAGRVTVNGQVISELGVKVMPADEVRLDGQLLQGEKKVYIVMNKPKGFVTTIDDPHAEKTVMELLKNACTERVYPVGRLDKNSLGVLLFTNDGDLTKRLLHPSYNKKKVYQVALDRPITQADMRQISEGIELEDGFIAPDAIEYVGHTKKEVGIEIHSGRNRIVRRMFDAMGYSVQKLDRVYFAGLTKQKLKRGEWRFLTPREVSMLKSGEYE